MFVCTYCILEHISKVNLLYVLQTDCTFSPPRAISRLSPATHLTHKSVYMSIPTPNRHCTPTPHVHTLSLFMPLFLLCMLVHSFIYCFMFYSKCIIKQAFIIMFWYYLKCQFTHFIFSEALGCRWKSKYRVLDLSMNLPLKTLGINFSIY